MEKYIVKWVDIKNPSFHGQGQPMPLKVAQAVADAGNRAYPNLRHEVVEVSGVDLDAKRGDAK